MTFIFWTPCTIKAPCRTIENKGQCALVDLSFDCCTDFRQIIKFNQKNLLKNISFSLKKRKLEKGDSRMREECQILLQQINVDTFLNNIYGNS